MKHTIYTFILLISFGLQAQEKIVSGIVIDSLTQEPLPFTNIGVVGRDLGSISNSEGRYTLSLEDVLPTDTVFFSFVGYKHVKFPIQKLMDNSTVNLSENAVQLSDFSVLSREYTPLEIIDLAKKNYSKNHSVKYQNQQMFSRDASYTTIHKGDIKYKKSSFEAINKDFVDHFNEEMPENINIYSDYLVDMMYSDDSKKLIPIEGQSLVENWNFNDEFDRRVKMLAGDIEENVREEDNYFKVRSGVFAGKIDFGADSAFTLTDDSLHFIMSTDVLQGDLNYLVKQYSTIYSKRWDFFHEYKLYNYKLKDIAIVNDELAYVIDFAPEKKKGKYKGTICIATESFAVLQVDYAFDEGKTGKGVSMLGVAYVVGDRSGRAIFEKGVEGYHLKYLARESSERFGVDRTLTLKQKQQRGLFDKTLQEVKIKLDLDLTFVQKKEVLVVSHRKINQEEFDKAEQPNTMMINKVSKYSSDIWENSSIIEPTKALKEYQQQY